MRISAAKRLRDRASATVRQAGEDRVTVERVVHGAGRKAAGMIVLPLVPAPAGTEVPPACSAGMGTVARLTTAIPVARDGRGKGRKAVSESNHMAMTPGGPTLRG